jgi:hypothetical protein
LFLCLFITFLILGGLYSVTAFRRGKSRRDHTLWVILALTHLPEITTPSTPYQFDASGE